jgi:hypothetical protein
MEKFYIPGTKKTPAVILDHSKGVLDIRGYSIPEDPSQFYKLVESAVNEYLLDPPKKTTITIFFKYFNTGTSKWILFLLLQFKHKYQDEKAIVINWIYERDDDDAMEAGTGFSTLLNFPFNLIEEKESKE